MIAADLNYQSVIVLFCFVLLIRLAPSVLCIDHMHFMHKSRIPFMRCNLQYLRSAFSSLNPSLFVGPLLHGIDVVHHMSPLPLQIRFSRVHRRLAVDK